MQSQAHWQRLLGHLKETQQLAHRLGLPELQANQKFWQLRLLQQQSEDIQQLLQQQHGLGSSSQQQQQQQPSQALQHSQQLTSVCADEPPALPHDGSDASKDTHPQALPQDRIAPAARPSNGSDASNMSPRRQHGQQAAFTLQFPLTLTRPMNPLGTTTSLQRALYHQHHHQQQQQQQQPQKQEQQQQQASSMKRQHMSVGLQQEWQQQRQVLGEVSAPPADQMVTEPHDQQQQQRQQQMEEQQQQEEQLIAIPRQQKQQLQDCQQRVSPARSPDQPLAGKPSRLFDPHTFVQDQAHQHYHYQQQQQQWRLQQWMAASSPQSSSGEYGSHQTCLLDTLAVAAAAAAAAAAAGEDPTVFEEPTPLPRHMRPRHTSSSSTAAAMHKVGRPGLPTTGGLRGVAQMMLSVAGSSKGAQQQWLPADTPAAAATAGGSSAQEAGLQAGTPAAARVTDVAPRGNYRAGPPRIGQRCKGSRAAGVAAAAAGTAANHAAGTAADTAAAVTATASGAVAAVTATAGGAAAVTATAGGAVAAGVEEMARADSPQGGGSSGSAAVAHNSDPPSALPGPLAAAAPAAPPPAAAGRAHGSGGNKSALLELADQLGGQVLEAAAAAVAAGQPLSYEGVMQLLSPLQEPLQGVLGSPLTEVQGWRLEDVQRMFFLPQAHAARAFGLGPTRFKPVLRSLGVRYWPQRQFMALVDALNFLADKDLTASKDGADIPARMLVLHHAWFVINNHPNVQLDAHAATAVKKAIHKQCFKERLKEQQAGGAAAQHAPARCRGKRSHAELDSSSPTPDEEAGLGGAAGAVAAAAGGGPAGSGTGGAAGTTAEVAGPNEVISQVYKALTVWPEPLRYLAEQAATTLLLPIADAEL